MSDKPEVLFVRVYNAGRSQMAVALLDHHAQGRGTVRAAGSAPADTINPAVVAVMAEDDIDHRVTELLAELVPPSAKPLRASNPDCAPGWRPRGCGTGEATIYVHR